MSDQEKRVTVGVEELAYSNMMTLKALVELTSQPPACEIWYLPPGSRYGTT